MTPITYNPDTAPILWLIGYGYRPAWQPAASLNPPPGNKWFPRDPIFRPPTNPSPGPGHHCVINCDVIVPPTLPPVNPPPLAPLPLEGAALYLVAALTTLFIFAVARWGVSWLRTLISCFDRNYDSTGWCGHDNLMPKGGYAK